MPGLSLHLRVAKEGGTLIYQIIIVLVIIFVIDNPISRKKGIEEVCQI